MRKMVSVMLVGIVTLLFLSTLAFAQTQNAYQRLLEETKTKVSSTGIELDTPFCNPNHPNRDRFIADFSAKDPNGAVALCLMQYAGALALDNQTLRKENKSLTGRIAEILALGRKQVAEVARLKLEQVSLKNETAILNQKLTATEERAIAAEDKLAWSEKWVLSSYAKWLLAIALGIILAVLIGAGILQAKTRSKKDEALDTARKLADTAYDQTALKLRLDEAAQESSALRQRAETAERNSEHHRGEATRLTSELAARKVELYTTAEDLKVADALLKELSARLERTKWQGFEVSFDGEGATLRDSEDKSAAPFRLGGFQCPGPVHGPTVVKPKNWRRHFTDYHQPKTSPVSTEEPIESPINPS